MQTDIRTVRANKADIFAQFLEKKKESLFMRGYNGHSVLLSNLDLIKMSMTTNQAVEDAVQWEEHQEITNPGTLEIIFVG